MPRLTTTDDPGQQPPTLLTVPDVAALLQVSEEQVYRWCRAGDIASVKLGPQTLRIRPAALEDFIGNRAA